MLSPTVELAIPDQDRRLVFCAALCAVVAALLMVTWDRGLSTSVLVWEAPLARLLFTQATLLGDWRVEASALLLAIGGGYLLGRSRLLAVGLCGVGGLFAAGLLTQLLKHASCRVRPLFPEAGTFQLPLCFQEGMDSFPSGHASQAFAIAVIVAAAYPRLALPLYGLAAAIGLSRVFLGAHYASDVLVGVAVGLLVGALCRRGLPRLAVNLAAWRVGQRSALDEPSSSP